jgi:hypothetical protein
MNVNDCYAAKIIFSGLTHFHIDEANNSQHAAVCYLAVILKFLATLTLYSKHRQKIFQQYD